MTGIRIAIAVITLLMGVLVAAMPAQAAMRSHHRYPVIGCDDLRSGGQNRYSWRHAPRGYCETGGSLGSTEGIDHAHWRGWGRAKAHARGYLVDGLGFMYRARITAYGLYHCHNCFGIAGYDPSWYRWLHVVSKGGSRGGARRGPFNVTINVTPQN